MSPRLSLALRLSTNYAAQNIFSGIQTPVWPLFLAIKGLDPSHIGLVFSAAYVVKLVSNPIAGHISDLLGDRRLPMMVLAVIALVSYAFFFPIEGFLPIVGLTLIGFGAYSAVVPLADSLTLALVAPAKLQYGRVRVWGSIAFIGASFLSSDLLIGAPTDDTLWAMLATLVAMLFTAWRLPRVKGERMSGKHQPIGALLRNPTFMLFLATVTLSMSSNAALYGFSTLRWRAAGIPGGTIGLFWIEMVTAESLLFIFGHRIANRVGPCWLLIAGAIGGIIRWTVTGLSVDPLAIASVQWMHCLTFTATHIGSMYFIQRSIPHEMSARAQGLYQAIANGANFGVLMPLAGWLYETQGSGAAFLSMIVLSAGGLVLAILLLRSWKGGPTMASAEMQPAE